MHKASFSKNTYQNGDLILPYRFHLPEGYDNSGSRKYPVVLFLHGAGERGDDNEAQLKIGIGSAMSDPESPLREAFIIAPQCPLDRQWVNTLWGMGNYSTDEIPETIELQTALMILADVCTTYRCDKNRIYVMGISMGGFGTWDCLARHSDLFAGGFPCCGGGDPSKADLLKALTIYTYHGALDGDVPVEGTREMVASIRAAGGDRILYTEYPDQGHWIWDTAYSDFKNIRALFLVSK